MSPHPSPIPNRRKSPRHYLDEPMPTEVVYGRRRFAVESGRICDISHGGIGIRAAHSLNLAPGTPVTVATAVDGEVVAVTGRVAFAEHHTEFGVEVDDLAVQRRLERIAERTKSVVVEGLDGPLARIRGKLSMAARQPIQWAIRHGARRLDLARVSDINSAGLGLLALLNERAGLRVERCPKDVCRLVKLAHLGDVCAPDCPRRKLPE